jgi:hypothetical protein
MMEDGSLKHRDDVVPFYYPCSICGVYTFHLVYEQHDGLASGTKLSTRKLESQFLLVCVKCTATSARLTHGEVESLAQRTIPESIHSVYPHLRTLYDPAFFDLQKQRNLEALSPEAAERIDRYVRHYRLMS